jgi:hypothetical protein
MTWLPHARHTLVTPWAIDEATHMLSCFTRDVNDFNYADHITDRTAYKFNGQVYEKTFKLSKWVRYPQNFMPIAKGTIDETKEGTIVTIDYELFPASKILLRVSFVMCLTLAVLFCFQGRWMASGITAVLFILGYLVVLGNFTVHTKDCHKVFLTVWEL